MSDKQSEQKKVIFSDFDREVLARLPLTMSQREALIKSMGQRPSLAGPEAPAKSMSVPQSPLVVDRKVSVEVVSKPSVGATSHVDM